MNKGLKVAANLYKFISAFKKGAAFLNYPPLRLWIEPTSICNLRCNTCPNSKVKKNNGFMDLVLYEKILNEVKDYVYDINLFLGGESLLHPEIVEFIKLAKERKILTTIHTNATLLDNKMSEKLVLSGLDFISFSFEGYSKKIYEKIRAGAKYEDVYFNIMNFLKIKKKLKKKKPAAILQVLSFKDKSLDFVKDFKKEGVNIVRVIPCHLWRGTIENLWPNNRGNLYAPCEFLWYSMNILWDGSVVPCCADFTGVMKLGNIKVDKLLDIWNGAKMLSLREKIGSGRFKEIILCQNCDLLFRKTTFRFPTSTVESFLEKIFSYNLTSFLINLGRKIVNLNADKK